VFILLGASATLLSGLIYEYLDILRIVGGIIIIIFGIHFMQIIQLPFLNRDTRYQIESYRPGVVGSYVIGLSFAFGWTPCIGPILGSVLSIAASSETVTYGIVLLMLYSAGLGIPFLLAAYAINGFMRFLTKIRNYIRVIEIFTGVLLVIFGILILTNRIQELAFFFIKYLPFLTQFG
jgi:cytochrome c-type biogenesis protein